MKKSKKITRKVKRKTKGRLFLAFIFFSILISSLGYNLILNILTIQNINRDNFLYTCPTRDQATIQADCNQTGALFPFFL